MTTPIASSADVGIQVAANDPTSQGGFSEIVPQHQSPVGFGSALRAGYEAGNNWVFNLIRAQADAATMNGMAPEPDFDVFDGGRYDMRGYELDAGRFVDARSRQQADYIKGRIDAERGAQDDLHRAGFFSAATANIITSIGPEILAGPGASAARTVGRVSALDLAAGVARNATSPHQGLEDLAESAVQSGLLSGVFSHFRPMGEWMASKPELQKPLGAWVKEGVAADRAINLNDVAAGKWVTAESSVGARQAPGARFWGPDDSKLASAFGTEKIPTTWLMRSMNSGVEDVRDIAAALADHGMFQRGNFVNKASEQSVEAKVGALWNGRLYDTLKGTIEDYLDYRGAAKTGSPLLDIGRSKVGDLFSGRGASMSFKEFREAVTDALENGDRHFEPAVEAAAKRYRAHINELRDAATYHDLWAQPVVRELRQVEEQLAAAQQAQQAAARNNLSSPNGAAQVQKLQARVDELKDKIDTLRTQGPAPGGSETWFKRMWRHDEVRQRRGDLEARIDHFIAGRPDLQQAGMTGREAVDAILDRQPFRQVVEDPSPAKSSMRERGLGWIPSTLVTDFLERDAEVLMRRYHREMSVDIELTRRFGSWDMHDAIESAKAAGASLREIEDLRTGRDFLRSTLGWQDPDSILTHASTLAKMYANVTLLGGSTVTALMDVARPVMVEGITRVFSDGLKPFLEGVGQQAYQLAKADAITAGVGGEILLWMRAHGQFNVDGGLNSGSRLMQTAERAHNLFFLANLIAPWTDMMKTWSSMIVQGRIRDTAAALARGEAVEAGDLLRLSRSGIDERMAQRIHEQFETHGIAPVRHGPGSNTFTQTGTKLANLGAWTDAGAKEAFAAAVFSDVNRTIVTPGIADKATMMEKGLEIGGHTWIPAPVMGVLSQYYAFAIASTQKMMVAGLQQRDMAFVSGMMATVGLAAIVNEMRDSLNKVGDRPAGPPRSTGDKVFEAIDRSGMLGYFGNLNNAIERLSMNQVGLRPALGLVEPGGSGLRQLSALGPTGTTLSNVWKATTPSDGDGRAAWQQAQAIRKLLPMQNVFYLDGLFDRMQQGIYQGLRG